MQSSEHRYIPIIVNIFTKNERSFRVYSHAKVVLTLFSSCFRVISVSNMKKMGEFALLTCEFKIKFTSNVVQCGHPSMTSHVTFQPSVCFFLDRPCFEGSNKLLCVKMYTYRVFMLNLLKCLV